MFKKVLASVLAGAIVFGGAAVLPDNMENDFSFVKAFAQNSEQDPYAIVHSGNYDYRLWDNDEYILLKYTGKETNVIVPSVIDGKTVIYVDVNAFDGCDWLKSITIPKGVQLRGSTYISKTEFESPVKGLTINCYGASNNGVILSNPINDNGDYTVIYSDLKRYNGFEYYIENNNAVIVSYTGNQSEIVIPETIEGNKVIALSNNTFVNTENIKSIKIPKGITFSQYYGLYNYFMGYLGTREGPGIDRNMVINTKSNSILFILSKDYADMYKVSSIENSSTHSKISYNIFFYDLTDIQNAYYKSFGNYNTSSERGVDGINYNGKAQTYPVRDFYNGTVKLVEGTDYTVTYKDNVNAGTATQTITGKGNYTGTITNKFNIGQESIEKCSFDIPVTGFSYTGKEIKPAVTIKFNGATLKQGTDYTISYTNNINVGIATMDIKGKGNFYGTHTVSYLIVKDEVPAEKQSIKSAKISGLSNKTYTGKAIKQTPVVKLSGKTLKSGTDYTVSYKNNKAVGTATVTITGKGAYTGTASKTFKILPKKTTLKTAKSPKTKQLKVTYSKVSGVTGYQVTYSTSSKFTKATTKSVNVKGTSKTISKLTKGKTYYVKVRTYKTVGKTKFYSGYSAVKKVKVK
ncbi:hypothetical protein [Ruminococcus sp. NK3A76]|uniref:hypothetical protein n=1 Tax=Ruminococcus sp. NK3A76 TaxID=877411 RepID=UPI00048B881C|nr:hypothetical protein [Ruminococcus sp. NK3A76]